MFRRTLAILPVVALTIATTGAATDAAFASTSMGTPKAAVTTHPAPSHFTHGRVDNRWFPLRPGNLLVFKGTEAKNKLRDAFFVTYRTKVVDGVTCRAIFDQVFQNGVRRERTTDWYAQTKAGTVWYFGERTALLNRHGKVVSRAGSFRSGRNGAQAGIFMPAHPMVGQSFKQESAPGQAEDRFTILNRNAHISTPVIGSNNAMLTKETTKLEPGVLDHKYYVRDIGTVRELTVKGGSESLMLTSVSHHHR